jgi:hypothetical protein
MSKLKCLAGAAMLVATCAGGAAAQDAPAPPNPKECIADSGGFKVHDKKPAFVITLENKCERRIRCRVFANVTTARDAKRVQTTMTLAPKSQGAKAKRSYAVRIHEAGGMAQTSRQCKFL